MIDRETNVTAVAVDPTTGDPVPVSGNEIYCSADGRYWVGTARPGGIFVFDFASNTTQIFGAPGTVLPLLGFELWGLSADGDKVTVSTLSGFVESEGRDVNGMEDVYQCSRSGSNCKMISAAAGFYSSDPIAAPFVPSAAPVRPPAGSPVATSTPTTGAPVAVGVPTTSGAPVSGTASPGVATPTAGSPAAPKTPSTISAASPAPAATIAIFFTFAFTLLL